MKYWFAAGLVLGLNVVYGQNYRPEKKPHNAWSRIINPTNDLSESVGGYANGCLLGAKMLPPSGTGFVDMRRNRNRFYGQPELIDFIEGLGQYTHRRYQRKHLIGDLSQPRGGKMNFGHSSHQIGLDVDVWMQTVPDKSVVNPYRDMRTVVDKIGGVIQGGELSPATRDALYYAATYPKTARVFVNPVVKWHLCQTESNTAWLNKIRPWWGHDQHFHVRLQCPISSLDCNNQKPVSSADGCDENLWNWVDEQSGLLTGRIKPKPKSKRKRKPKQLPERCELVNVQ